MKETKSKNIGPAGDTALTYGMKLFPLAVKLDLTAMPIGNNFAMDVKDAVIILILYNATKHWHIIMIVIHSLKLIMQSLSEKKRQSNCCFWMMQCNQ